MRRKEIKQVNQAKIARATCQGALLTFVLPSNVRDTAAQRCAISAPESYL